MKTVNLSGTFGELQGTIEQVIGDGDVALISRPDATDAVVMSADQYSSLMETLYLLGTPANAEHLTRSIQQARTGSVQRRELFDTRD